MKTFDIYKQGEKFKAVKQGKSANGTFMTSLSAPSTTAAVTRFKAQLKNGSLDANQLTDATNQAIAKEMKQSAGFAEAAEVGDNKAIYCDFNGVLDDRDKNLSCNEWNAGFRLPKVVDVDRLYEVAKLAVKHNAKLVMISEWRKDGVTYYTVIGRALRNSDNEEHQAFLNENRRKLRELCSDVTTVSRNRDTEIKQHIEFEEITNCVVLEDEHPISAELNPIMVHHPGLNMSHIERADAVLSQ